MLLAALPNSGVLKKSCVQSLERMKNRPPGAVSNSGPVAWKPTLVMSMLRPLMSLLSVKTPLVWIVTSPVAVPAPPIVPCATMLASPATFKVTPWIWLAGLFSVTLPVPMVVRFRCR